MLDGSCPSCGGGTLRKLKRPAARSRLLSVLPRWDFLIHSLFRLLISCTVATLTGLSIFLLIFLADYFWELEYPLMIAVLLSVFMLCLFVGNSCLPMDKESR
jgi:hypothetical protein